MIRTCRGSWAASHERATEQMNARSRVLLAASALALAQLRLIVGVLGDDFVRSAEAAQGVVAGYPHWRIYQSRILGPYLVDALSHVFPSFLSAYTAFAIAALAIAGILAYRLGTRVGGTRAGIAALLAFHLAFALLVSRPWLYAWDFVDAIVFLVFVDFVVARRPWPHFLALIGFGVLNHEIAAYIAVWLVVDPLAQWRWGKAPLAWRPMVAGALAFVASLGIAELIRGALLVEQIGPKIFHDAPTDIGSSFYFTLGHNVDALVVAFTRFDYRLPQLVPIFLVAIIAYALVLARRDVARFGALAATYLAIIAALLTFGVLLETRIYVVLIPLVALAAARISASPEQS